MGDARPNGETQRPALSHEIAIGAAGDAVRDVQERLMRAGAKLHIDGSFGAVTREAIQRFQRDRGLAADGIVGPETWRALVEAGFALGDRLLWHTHPMMRGDDVLQVQHRLNQLGFDAGSEDGIFGPLAAAAVAEFQRNTGLHPDGIVGPRTIDLLRRLKRAHQSSGLAPRVREREALRRLAGRGLSGVRIVLDPAHGPGDPGHIGPTGLREGDITWAIAVRTAAHLVAHGVDALLSRGPATTPDSSARARFANEQEADLVLSIGLNAHANPHACGSAGYYFGAPGYVSEAGWRLAELVQEEIAAAGWVPDCRVHPMTWGILRETRMPVAVTEPGFITCPTCESRLREPSSHEELARALTNAVARLLSGERAPLRPASGE